MSRPAPICYLEIPAPDIERAIAFYGSVFGWTITPSDLTAEPYAMFSTGEGALGGEFGFSAVFSDPNGNHVGLWCQT